MDEYNAVQYAENSGVCPRHGTRLQECERKDNATPVIQVYWTCKMCEQEERAAKGVRECREVN